MGKDDNVIKMPEKPDDQLWFNVLALCVSCQHRWVATLPQGTCLLHLECPDCGDQNSFASFYPDDYLEETDEH